MAITGDGASYYAASAGTITALGGAYTYAFWLNQPNPAANSTAKHPFSLTEGSGVFDINFAWDHPNAGAWKGAFHRGANLTYYTIQHPGTPATGEWHHWAVSYDGGTVLSLYYDGALVATSAVTAAASSPNPNVTVLAYNSGASGFNDGSIADLCIWDVCLTAAQVMSIADGSAAPNSVQSGHVVQYVPLNADGDTVTGQTLTNFSGVYNGSYFTGMNGGPAVGSGATFQTNYGFVPSGGVAVGSGAVVRTTYTFAPTGGVAIGSEMTGSIGYHYTMTGGVAVGSQIAPATSYTVAMTGGVAVGSRFRVEQVTTASAVVIANNRTEALTTRP